VNERPTNWARNITFGADRLEAPKSVEQLQELVANSDPVRALGSGHSFSNIADTPGVLVSLAGLPQRVEIDVEQSTARVSAGIRYTELCPRLNSNGYALHNLGSLPHVSVAGSCATATHGSGDGNGNLATAVSAIELVTADGSLRSLSRKADGDLFNGAVVGLGSVGIVTSLTLDLQPSFDVQQYVFEGLPFDVLVARTDEIFAGGYSVSVFTDWRNSRTDLVWVKHRTDDPSDPAATFFGARPADAARNPVPGMPADNCTEQMGVPGPWYERLPHFRPDFTPSSGDELQSEYLVPRRHAADALDAVRRIGHRVAPVLQISELRTVASDELWMSPCYRRDVLGIHFTWVDDMDAVLPVIGLVERVLALFDATPHWGKLSTTPAEVVRALYPRLGDFRDLVRDLDPDRKFRNAFVDRYLLEDR
jgi:xylitol oxidase